jgi:hypothetical protein
MSFFGGTNNGKISTKKSNFKNLRKKNLVWNQTLNTFNHECDFLLLSCSQ